MNQPPRTEILTKSALEEALADELDDDEIAARFHVHPDSVQRAMVRHGFREPRDIIRWTPEIDEFAHALNDDGVPLVWIAETIRCGRDTLVKHGIRRGADERMAWLSVWQEILKNPVLLALHREFAPKTQRQIVVERTLIAA